MQGQNTYICGTQVRNFVSNNGNSHIAVIAVSQYPQDNQNGFRLNPFGLKEQGDKSINLPYVGINGVNYLELMINTQDKAKF